MNRAGELSVPLVPRIAFYNVKGGTGKSAIAAASAIKMAESGLSVGLIDMDFQSPDQQYILNMTKTFKDVADAMDFRNLYPFQHENQPNLHVFSMGFMVRDALAVLLDEAKILEAVHTIFTVVKWPDDLDVFVLDMPPQTSKLNIKIAKELMNDPDRDAICIVTTPRQESIMDALRALDMLKFFNVRVMGAVVNMAFHDCLACGHREQSGMDIKFVESQLGINIVSVVPFTNDIGRYLEIDTMLEKVGVTICDDED